MIVSERICLCGCDLPISRRKQGHALFILGHRDRDRLQGTYRKANSGIEAVRHGTKPDHCGKCGSLAIDEELIVGELVAMVFRCVNCGKYSF